MHRDVITVNGQMISGATGGPEEMIGVLVRTILEQVQSMREKYVASVGPPLSAASSTEQISDVRRRLATFADMDESQALSCARDVLLSCNRTQSGGDTYYTVESLFVNKEFAVLTPFACEADPLEIVVDIVESEKRRLASLEEHSDNGSLMARPDRQDPTSRGGALCGALSCDDVEEGVAYGRFDVHGRHSDHSRGTDDTTESSGHTHSASEDEESKDQRGRSYPSLTAYSPSVLGIHYDTTAELPSDIAGATALPSTVLMSREQGRRGKPKGTGMNSGGSSIASGSSESTEAEATHSTPDDMYVTRLFMLCIVFDMPL